MKFEMTRCNQCGSEVLMGVDVCPSCGKQQARGGGVGYYQPRMLLAIALTAAVLIVFNWMKSSPPYAGQVNSPPSTIGAR